ncbi:MAG: hypothetical protein K2O67_01730, partial [Clostridia bacterium]|nr:hypothetical protein [Clostridia bacterium]
LSVCFDGLCLWAESVLPSLFPFMIITALLIKLGAPQAAAKPFAKISAKMNLPQATLPLFLMSAFSGYPAGSKILCEYCDCGYITEREAQKLAPLCSTCGPLFALGTVGAKAFGGNGAGAKLLCSCLISVVVCWLVFCLITRKKAAPSVQRLASVKRENNLLQAVFTGGVTACLVAGGFICFFYTLSQVFADFNIFKPLELVFSLIFGTNISQGLAQGLCEATGGCFALARAGGFFALPLAGFLITFGGASIILQQICYLANCGVKLWKFTLFKFVQALVCFGVLCILCLF